MRRIMLVAVLAAVAACSETETEIEPTETIIAPEEQARPEPQVLSADGQPPVGKYNITTSDGEVVVEELLADGSYVSMIDGEVVETGRWEQRSPNEFCYLKDEEFATEQCNSEMVDESGIWTSTNPEGGVSTVKRVQE